MYLLGNRQPYIHSHTHTHRASLAPQNVTWFYKSTTLKPAELCLSGAAGWGWGRLGKGKKKKGVLEAFAVSSGSP